MSSSGEVKVPLGQIVATPAVLGAVSQPDIAAALRRHVVGDWGDVTPGDRASNNDALQSGERMMSVYLSATGITFWVLTEADRSVTTVLLPDDY
jgi:hypothetical protein